jgi:hypothetical protein
LLVVESDDALRDHIVAVLSDAGYEVSTDYREGMKAVLAFDPDAEPKQRGSRVPGGGTGGCEVRTLDDRTDIPLELPAVRREIRRVHEGRRTRWAVRQEPVLDDSMDIVTDRHKSRFVKLRLADANEVLCEVHIGDA